MHNITMQNYIWLPQSPPQKGTLVARDPREGLVDISRRWVRFEIKPLDAAGIFPHQIVLVKGREEIKGTPQQTGASYFELLPTYIECGLESTLLSWRLLDDPHPVIMIKNHSPYLVKLWGGAHIGNLLLGE